MEIKIIGTAWKYSMHERKKQMNRSSILARFRNKTHQIDKIEKQERNQIAHEND